MRLSVGWVVVVLLTGCGGSIDTSLLDGGGNGSDGGGVGSDAAADAGPASCDQLLAAVSAQAATVTQCCETCNLTQCDRLIEGVCCPLTVDKNTPVAQYLAAVDAFRAAKCQAVCPAVVCPDTPSYSCGPSGKCMQ